MVEGEAMEEQGKKDGKEGGGGKGSIWPSREPASARKKASGMLDRQACVGGPRPAERKLHLKEPTKEKGEKNEGGCVRVCVGRWGGKGVGLGR